MSETRRRRKWDEKGDQPTPPSDIVNIAAARINEQLRQRPGLGYGKQTVPIPPQVIIPGQLGVFEKEIEINDSKNRYYLTKGTTHELISKETGATIITKGRYYAEGEKREEGDERPLYLHVSADTQESLDAAIRMIEKFMREKPQLYPYTAKLYVGLDGSLPGFNVPANIIGPKGSYVKHITQKSGGVRVQLKGRGSGYKDPETGEESNEAMHLHLASMSEQNLQKAKELAESLLNKVRKDYQKFLDNRKKRREQNKMQQQETYNDPYYYYQYYAGYYPHGYQYGQQYPTDGTQQTGQATDGTQAQTTQQQTSHAPTNTQTTPQTAQTQYYDYSAYQQCYNYQHYAQPTTETQGEKKRTLDEKSEETPTAKKQKLDEKSSLSHYGPPPTQPVQPTQPFWQYPYDQQQTQQQSQQQESKQEEKDNKQEAQKYDAKYQEFMDMLNKKK